MKISEQGTIITLESGTTQAKIDTSGAYLTELRDDRGDVLYPRFYIEKSDGTRSVRGGVFACIPNFGPGGESGQLQHGYGRMVLWTPRPAESSTDRLSLEHNGGAKGYETLRSQITYRLGQQVLHIEVALMNVGDTPLRLAPGLHPYFATDGQPRARLGRLPLALDELSDAVLVKGENQTVTTSRRTIEVMSDGWGGAAVWTDAPEKYLCVEPTDDLAAFSDPIAVPAEMLQPGQERIHTATISWENNEGR